jgi:hypothetical protein
MIFLAIPSVIDPIMPYLNTAGIVATVGVFIYKSGQWARDRERTKGDVELSLENYKKEVKKDLDGFGTRVTSIEQRQNDTTGRLEVISTQIERTLGAHESLLRVIGEARGSTIQCREDTQALGEKIERKFDIASEKSEKNHLDLSTRLSGVEKELELMRRSSR